MVTIGTEDPDYPPDLPVTGECVPEHRYHEMKKAESDAVHAAKRRETAAPELSTEPCRLVMEIIRMGST